VEPRGRARCPVGMTFAIWLVCAVAAVDVEQLARHDCERARQVREDVLARCRPWECGEVPPRQAVCAVRWDEAAPQRPRHDLIVEILRSAEDVVDR